MERSDVFARPIDDLVGPGSTWLEVGRGLRTARDPFRPAVEAHDGINGAARALGVWNSLLDGLLAQLTSRWSAGTSVDPFEGDVLVGVTPGSPSVSVVIDAVECPPHPMHLRSVAQIAELIRPSMVQAGPISARELAGSTARMVHAGIDRFPLTSSSDPRSTNATLSRMRSNYTLSDSPAGVDSTPSTSPRSVAL